MSIQLAAMTHSFGPGTLSQTLEHIVNMGFRRIDLAAGPHYQVNALAAAQHPDYYADLVQRDLEHFNIELCEVYLVHFGVPINHPDPDERARTRSLFEGFAHFCHASGAQSIMVSPGIIFDELGMEKSIELAIQELRSQQEVCARWEIQLDVEPHWHSWAESPDMALRLCRQVPGVMLTVDYAGFIAQGYEQSDVEPLHPYIHHLHARQAKPGHNHATRGEGVIDFRRIIRKLKTDDWHGIIALEYYTSRIENPQEEIRWLKGQIELHMQQV